MSRQALGAVAAQGVQAGISFVLQVLVAQWLGVAELGRFAILYGLVIVVSGLVTGYVGDSLVVLDRGESRIRSALQGSALALIVAGAVAAAVVVALLGLISPAEAIVFAVAMAVFVTEELLRRLLMASFSFFRVAAADGIGFAVALAMLLTVQLTIGATLFTFLAAIAVGQLAAIVAAVILLPATERRLSPPRRGGYRDVAAYGTWRGMQQLLRPGLLTVLRLAVAAFAGLAAVGLLEAARVYVAPAMLVIGGLSSYLFVGYARDRDVAVGVRLRRADRAVGWLLAITVALGIVALLLLGWAGPLLFGTPLDAIAVAGWLAYAASVAAVTPYGTLAAVVGKQSLVFGIRAGDTLVAAATLIVALWAGVEPRLLPLLLAVVSVLGGLAIRFLVLARRQPEPA
jgi:O-antigen/teichoic acid export membrane protein